MRQPYTYSLGEFIDKLTIVSKKDLMRLKGARKELNLMMKWMNDSGIDGYFILSVIRIAQANMDIWNQEHELRNASEGDFPLSEVGRRAILIRELNKTRIRYKNEINLIGSETSIEEKIKHLSEETYDRFYSRE